MSVLNYARTAAAAAALAMLPAHAVAQAPSALPGMAASVAAQDDTAEADEGGNPFFGEYLIPTVIVIVLALALYFGLEDDGDTTGTPPVSA